MNHYMTILLQKTTRNIVIYNILLYHYITILLQKPLEISLYWCLSHDMNISSHQSRLCGPRGAGLSSLAPSMRKTTASVAAMVDVGGPAGAEATAGKTWESPGVFAEMRNKNPAKLGKNGESLEMRKNFGHISDFPWGEMEISSGFDHMKWWLKWVWIKKRWFHWIQPL